MASEVTVVIYFGRDAPDLDEFTKLLERWDPEAEILEFIEQEV